MITHYVKPNVAIDGQWNISTILDGTFVREYVDIFHGLNMLVYPRVVEVQVGS